MALKFDKKIWHIKGTYFAKYNSLMSFLVFNLMSPLRSAVDRMNDFMNDRMTTITLTHMHTEG